MNIQIKNIADLHMHSVHSDGSWTAKKLICTYADLGFKAISITDHDNINAYLEVKDLAKEKNIELIPGIELSTYEETSSVHILGYYLDPHNIKLNEVLKKMQHSRFDVMQKMIVELQKLGLKVSFDEIEAKNTKSLGRPHLAKLLITLKYVRNMQEAFDQYLTLPVILNIPRYRLSPEEGIDLIQEAGGVAVFAHPQQTGKDEIIPRLAKHGLDGIEVFTNASIKKKSIRKKYKTLADRYNLLYGGGSDFHGGYYNNLGMVEVPYDCVETLYQKAQLNKKKYVTV